jgi:hypothetical protein
MPHHVTQRGNRRQQSFFNDGDYAACLELMDLRRHGRTGRPPGELQSRLRQTGEGF